MSRSYTRDDVQTHYGSDRPAVNVKVYGGLREGWRAFEKYEPDHDPDFTLEWVEENVSEQTLDAIFWSSCESGWEMIQQDAEEIFGKGVTVEADGRSGGWAVVRGLDDLEDWDAIALSKWRRFEKLAQAEAADIPYQIILSVYINDWEAAKEDRRRAHGAGMLTVY